MKTLIIHFRSAPPAGWKRFTAGNVRNTIDSAGTDGVSLEMKKRRFMLEQMGHTVAICSAYEWAEYPLPEVEFDSTENRKLMRNMFERLEDYAGEEELKKEFDRIVASFEQRLTRILSTYSPEIVFVHNMLCLPIHPAATVALANVLVKTGIACTAIHHDILSEGAYKFKPTCDFSAKILQTFFPPVMHTMTHWTINSRNRKALKGKDIHAQIIHDTMDFDEKLDAVSHKKIRAELRAKFAVKENDIVLFMGARIVPNKQIEIAGALTARLQFLSAAMVNRKLYNSELFSEQSRVMLVIAGRPEAAFVDYQHKLFAYLDSLRISWKYVGDLVRPLRSESEGFYALYPDMYAMADFVVYPTGWEGFGNQLLEAFAAGLPVALFEYPVFKEDIGPKGVSVVSLGNTVLESNDTLVSIPEQNITAAAREIASILTNAEKYSAMTADNIAIGKKHFGFDVLRAHLSSAIEWAESKRNPSCDGKTPSVL
jgi:glycosyltransferase involved in cell wall biosynthesis